MSWSKGILAALLLALAACGFTPAYAPGGAGAALDGQVAIGEPSDRTTYLLVRQLEERLGRSADPAYDLGVTLVTTEEGLAVDADGNIDRYNLLGTVQYTLTDRRTGQHVAAGQVSNFTGYSATGTTVATLTAQRDAQARLMVILADLLTARLVAALA
ncbi:MAG: LPS assembly lipoprotein LptE [Pseudomonadota bacterium]